MLHSNIQFSSVCLGNGDMLIGASNSTKKVYLITTDFDGVGILETVNEMCSYADGLTSVSSLALSGDELAVCADGVLHIFDPTQGVTRIVTDLESQAISSHAVNVTWIGKDILFCEDHSVKMFQSGTVEVIAGNGKGGSDGSQTHFAKQLEFVWSLTVIFMLQTLVVVPSSSDHWQELQSSLGSPGHGF